MAIEKKFKNAIIKLMKYQGGFYYEKEYYEKENVNLNSIDYNNAIK